MATTTDAPNSTLASSPHDIEKGSFHHVEHGGRPPIQLTPEQYEKLFLQPGGKALPQGFSTRFGNPTPVGLASFLLALTPTGCYLMQWGGASATSLITAVGPYYFIGGLGQIIAGVMEWVAGNTFPSVVFITFGGFFLSLGNLNDPQVNVATASGGATAVPYTDGLMFYFAFWAVMSFTYFITALRTNVAFVGIFFFLVLTFALLAAGYAKLGDADASTAIALLKGAGAFAFVTCVIGWYLLAALIFAVVDMPFSFPVGDLSGFLARRSSVV
ncbi:hypothetical protein GYMLUDRAFT_152681 [Collybiopsis luxurians FD-317 M1]|nr:hypothetical protein GYMLUDRAFT_152681 [Collybiopsis luxurians FD-317 M1]